MFKNQISSINMEASTTINEMLFGNKIFIPSYHQRGYSWDTPFEGNQLNTQIDVFLSDLEEYSKSSSQTAYYFGHFLFEKKSESKRTYGVIDGQQRITTILIFLSALFKRLKSIRLLTEDEVELFERMIKCKSKCIFSTVNRDNLLFKDYVIDQIKKNKNGVETESAQRIVNAFDFFIIVLADKDGAYLTKMLRNVSEASCTTHHLKNETEAIQTYIFQSRRYDLQN